ncbi:hypothetical protein SAMN04487926_111244 [Paraburkholderia steynii]|uniref:Uncharacterized protein n=1 Tax=Paraburkholderia steynii TaxID=1245441 RepID=A0A7Z7B834_9BURK|nr:hypothetical protein SAMN04487926_111244 [Paraburkholderia steynii]
MTRTRALPRRRPRRRCHSPLSEAHAYWPNWLSSSMFIRKQIQSGSGNCRSASLACSRHPHPAEAVLLAELNARHVKTGQLTVEYDFLTGALGKVGRLSERDD